ncbi:hypothetical protein [Ferruginibacter sp. HRS2-29]|uniref:hypothetical protein n=1 Tax=Ferruginibacter sp. HRS2-29 TaxID=2487334 RepID=UPI0020CFC8B0|nr:hypothetical protein [Ferruginibacter sp. HRS2-29]MCP9751970.1 hypothetical protein [Ferruginibacter sp. HRS2-29]
MQRRFRIILLLVSLGLLFFEGCSKKGDPIVEPFSGRYKFTAFTIDSFRFRIVVDGQLVTDSLKSGKEFTQNFTFVEDTSATLKVYNAITGQLYVDSTMGLSIGSHIIPIVQLSAGTQPVVPGVPDETPPLAGNSKIRFQYVRPQPIATLPSATLQFYDSIKCIIRKNVPGAGGGVSYDTVVLHQNEVTKFYEARIGATYNIEVRDALTDFVYNNGTGVSINTTVLPALNTAILYSYDTLTLGRQRYRITRVY